MSLFPELNTTPPANQPRQKKPYDRVRCRSCQGWGTHELPADDYGPACSLECGTCGGTGRVRRDSLEDE